MSESLRTRNNATDQMAGQLAEISCCAGCQCNRIISHAASRSGLSLPIERYPLLAAARTRDQHILDVFPQSLMFPEIDDRRRLSAFFVCEKLDSGHASILIRVIQHDLPPDRRLPKH
jgi:hypothetical protein